MHVEDKARGFVQPVGAKKFFCRGKGFYGEAIRFHQAPDRLPYRIIVVDYHDDCVIAGHGLAPATNGKTNPKTAPNGDAGPAPHRPSWAFMTRVLTPNPLPR